jgi:hypothetical protein
VVKALPLVCVSRLHGELAKFANGIPSSLDLRNVARVGPGRDFDSLAGRAFPLLVDSKRKALERGCAVLCVAPF